MASLDFVFLMLLKVLCFLILTSFEGAGYASKDEDDSEHSSLVYKAFKESLVPIMTRPLVSFPFDVMTIGRQVTGDSYNYIFKGVAAEHRSVLMSIFKTHFIELTLRAQSTYFLYKYLTLSIQTLDSDSFLRHPVTSQLLTTFVMSSCDIFFTNPFERTKVAYMRKLDIPFMQNNGFNFYEIRKHRTWFFQGGALTFQSSFLHLNVFFGSNTFLKKALFNKQEEVTFQESCIMGPIIASIQASVTYPLLTLRALLHAERMRSPRNPVTMMWFLKNLYESNKMLTLYNGAGSRIFRGSLLACFDSYWINYNSSNKDI